MQRRIENGNHLFSPGRDVTLTSGRRGSVNRTDNPAFVRPDASLISRVSQLLRLEPSELRPLLSFLESITFSKSNYTVVTGCFSI